MNCDGSTFQSALILVSLLLCNIFGQRFHLAPLAHPSHSISSRAVLPLRGCHYRPLNPERTAAGIILNPQTLRAGRTSIQAERRDVSTVWDHDFVYGIMQKSTARVIHNVTLYLHYLPLADIVMLVLQSPERAQDPTRIHTTRKTSGRFKSKSTLQSAGPSLIPGSTRTRTSRCG